VCEAHELRIVSHWSSGIELAAGADVDPLVHVSLEAVATVALHADTDVHARIRTGAFHSDGIVALLGP